MQSRLAQFARKARTFSWTSHHASPLILVTAMMFLWAIAPAVRSEGITYVYDAQNRLIEVDYPDRVIKYTYDPAGNRTATIVQLVAVLQINTVTPVAGRTSGGQQIVLAGSFANLSTVTIGGNGATWSYTNAGDTTSITINTPAHSVARRKSI